jgi:hypothetical protein
MEIAMNIQITDRVLILLLKDDKEAVFNFIKQEVIKSIEHEEDKPILKENLTKWSNVQPIQQDSKNVICNIEKQETLYDNQDGEKVVKWKQQKGSELFEEFWSQYPKQARMNKKICIKYWNKDGLEERGVEVIGSLQNWLKSDTWKKGFIPFCQKFINQKYYEAQEQEKGRTNETHTAMYNAANAVKTGSGSIF